MRQRTFQLAKLWLAAAMLLLNGAVCLFGADGQANTLLAPIGAKALVDLPMELRDGLIIVPVQVNGSAPLHFILKSGEAQSMLSKSCAQSLGLIKRGRGFKARIDAGWDQRWKLSNVVFDLGDTSYTPPALVAGSLPAKDPLVDGYLGGDLFERFIVELDFSGLRMRLYDPTSFQPTTGWSAIPLKIQEGRPTVAATIPGLGTASTQAKFFVATEYPMSAVLDLKFARSNHLVKLSAPKHGFDRDTNGQYRAYFGHLPQILLGTVTVTNAEVMIAADSHNAIGTPLLQCFHVVFDQPHQQLWLASDAAYIHGLNPGYRPGKPFLLRLEDEFQVDFSGARFAISGPHYARFRVVTVGRASPAELAGVRRGDVVRSMDGQPPEKLSLQQWMRAVGEAGHQSQLEIQRDGALLQIMLPSNWQADPGN